MVVYIYVLKFTLDEVLIVDKYCIVLPPIQCIFSSAMR